MSWEASCRSFVPYKQRIGLKLDRRRKCDDGIDRLD
jgi:hypothetical protein